jgi:signal transduction histidine kinase
MRFWRADSTTGTTPGTGLGLSLVKEIIEAHHGTVNITSKYGLGTTVSILLPAADPPEQPLNVESVVV